VSGEHLTPLARRILSRVPTGTTVPRYGSTEWDDLPDQDPCRAAAVMIAAEAWREHCSPAQVALDLCRQLAEENAAVWRRMRETSWDVSAADDWAAASRRPTYAELQERRAS